MRIALFVLAALAVVATVIFLSRHFRREEHGPFGFREVLKDGRKRELLARQMNPENLDKLADSEVRDLVEAYVKTQHQSPEYWAVRALKERAVPFLIEVLKRPESFVKPEPKGSLDESPAQRALAMLAPFPQKSAIPLLLPFVDSTESWQRREAAGHLAATGKDSVKDAIRKLLGDPDDYVRSRAVAGLLSAANAQRAEPGLLAAAFAPLKELTTRRDKATCADTAAELLLRIDRPRAIEFLTSAAVINSTNLNVDRVLAYLTREQIVVPARFVLQLLDASAATSKALNAYVYGEALKALALQKHPAVEGLIQKTLHEPPAVDEAVLPTYQRSRPTRRKLAAQALCILNDLDDPVRTAFANEEKAGFSHLPIPQQRTVLIVHLDGQVSNGGFSQYFFNSSDDCAAVAAALQDVGAPDCARILRGAVSVFGEAGASRDLETRRRQLETLSAQQDEALDQADQRWFAAHEDLDVSLYLYALKHKSAWTPMKE